MCIDDSESLSDRDFRFHPSMKHLPRFLPSPLPLFHFAVHPHPHPQCCMRPSPLPIPSMFVALNN